MKSTRRSRGFSLIELSVVLGVVSTLAAIAIPQFRVSVFHAHDVERTELTTAIERMLLDYYNTHGQYPDVGGAQNPVEPVGTVEKWTDDPAGKPPTGWTKIGFKSDGQAYTYRYSFTTSKAGNPVGLYNQAEITATADLDGDRVPGIYKISLLDGSIITLPDLVWVNNNY